MGDRTYAVVYINKYYYEQNKKELDMLAEDSCYDTQVNDDIVEFHDDQANYGNIPSITDFLQENKIEYTLSWEDGGDYHAGSEYARIVNGEYKIHDIYDDGYAVLQELKTILNEKDPTKREALLKKRIKDLEPFEITPLKAPNSIDFIKSDE